MVRAVAREPAELIRNRKDVCGLVTALAQLPCAVGDLTGNVERILDAAGNCAARADLLVLPELSICGYPPEDLLAYGEFVDQCSRAADDLRNKLGRKHPDLHVLVGLPRRENGGLFNIAELYCGSKIVAVHRKLKLPNYGVFDEMRYFTPGADPVVATIKGESVALAVCHDIWSEDYVRLLGDRHVSLVAVANASPFHLGKQVERERVTAALAVACGCDVAYANYSGAQDELVFDGGSHYMEAGGSLSCRFGLFQQICALCEGFGASGLPSDAAQLRCALVEGVRAYVAGSGCGPVFLGLSGGIDSAVVACVAQQALGAGNVTAVMMPGEHTADMSTADAKQLARALGVGCIVMPIGALCAAVRKVLESAVGGEIAGTAAENLQSRARGLLLMALSNHHGGLVLTTGNKSEMATGFATLYGDMAGAFDVLKDVPKGGVYQLAGEFNRNGELIPRRIIERKPTAELRADQLDSDNLPDYPVLDSMLEQMVVGLRSPRDLAARIDSRTVAKFASLLKKSEFKRRQAPVGPNVSIRAFGKHWRMPVANYFEFELPDNGDGGAT